MSTSKRWWLLALPVMLAGCLEVDQYPSWVKGQYAGKRDQQPYEQLFHRDRLSWWATLSNRALRQNEYNRAKPPRQPLQAYEMQAGMMPQAPAQMPQSTMQQVQAERTKVQQTYSRQAQMPQPPVPQAQPGRAQPAPAAQGTTQPRAQPPRKGG